MPSRVLTQPTQVIVPQPIQYTQRPPLMVPKGGNDFGSRLVRNFSQLGAGSTIGNAILPGVGGILGHAAESLFRTIVGQGDYTEVIPSSKLPANNTIVGIQDPAVRQSVDQMHWSGLAVRVAHREFFTTVQMTNGFSVSRYLIDPTQASVFPWLADITLKFQKYKLLGMVFEYVPTSANAVSGGVPAMGSVSMAVDYDQYMNAPNGLAQMLNYQGAVSGRPTDNLIAAVECDPGYTPTNPLYVRHPWVGSGPNQLDYIFGQLLVATDGPVAYNGAGQLWVTYDLLLIQPFVDNYPFVKSDEKSAHQPEKPVGPEDEETIASDLMHCALDRARDGDGVCGSSQCPCVKKKFL